MSFSASAIFAIFEGIDIFEVPAEIFKLKFILSQWVSALQFRIQLSENEFAGHYSYRYPTCNFFLSSHCIHSTESVAPVRNATSSPNSPANIYSYTVHIGFQSGQWSCSVLQNNRRGVISHKYTMLYAAFRTLSLIRISVRVPCSRGDEDILLPKDTKR